MVSDFHLICRCMFLSEGQAINVISLNFKEYLVIFCFENIETRNHFLCQRSLCKALANN